MPILAKGILFVSRNLPDDPVEALADFLLDKTLEMEKNEELKKKNENIKEK